MPQPVIQQPAATYDTNPHSNPNTFIVTTQQASIDPQHPHSQTPIRQTTPVTTRPQHSRISNRTRSKQDSTSNQSRHHSRRQRDQTMHRTTKGLQSPNSTIYHKIYQSKWLTTIPTRRQRPYTNQQGRRTSNQQRYRGHIQSTILSSKDGRHRPTNTQEGPIPNRNSQSRFPQRSLPRRFQAQSITKPHLTHQANTKDRTAPQHTTRRNHITTTRPTNIHLVDTGLTLPVTRGRIQRASHTRLNSQLFIINNGILLLILLNITILVPLLTVF